MGDKAAVEYSLEKFITDHEVQLRSSGVPEHLWTQLHVKLAQETMDAGSVFQLAQIRFVSEEDPDDVSLGWQVVSTAKTLDPQDEKNIFLIDHAWSFDHNSARQHLTELPTLLARMVKLMDIPEDENDKLDAVMHALWRFCHFYNIDEPIVEKTDDDSSIFVSSSTQKTAIWYVLDEFGSRIQHSDDPTCRMVPLLYGPRGICYTLLWLTNTINEGEEVTVDMVEHVKSVDLRPYHLIPWRPEDFSEEDDVSVDLLTEEFFQSHRMNETLPLVNAENPAVDLSRPLRVYSNMSLISDNLATGDQRFVTTDDRSSADVLWLYEHFKDYEGLSRDQPNTFINQFPFESVVTVKDLLAVVCHQQSWLPLTFNLVHQLPQFIRHFQRRELANEDDQTEGVVPTTATTMGQQQRCNLWIVKPWNLGRGMGIVVTDCLEEIVRLSDAEPKIVSQYVTNPVLFHREDKAARVKFDLRYMVLLHTARPLKAFVYKVFWIRFANKEFSLTDLHDYEKHFTVMNYRDDSPLKQINCEEFVPIFETQYPDHPWSKVEARIHTVLGEIFSSATSFPPPRGLATSPQSRAIYAVDLLLEWRTDDKFDTPGMHPMICEVNFCPDCSRAVKYHPTFFPDVFSTLFLDQPRNSLLLPTPASSTTIVNGNGQS